MKCFCERPGVGYLFPDEHLHECRRKGKSWQETMDPDEVAWCEEQISNKMREIDTRND